VYVSHARVNKNSINVIKKIQAVARDMHGTIVMSVTCIEHDGNIIHKFGNEDIRSTACANDGCHAGVCEKQVNNERITKSVKSPFNGSKGGHARCVIKSECQYDHDCASSS
jgi:hypothetical protein